MAVVRTYVGLNFNQIDFYWYKRYLVDADANIGNNLVYNGITYPDNFYVNAKQGSDIMSLTFGGYNITHNGNGVITGGRVTGVIEQDLVTGGATFTIEGIDVSAVDVFNAYNSSSNADDLNLLRVALNGADDFHLSNGNDTAYGYGGNDRMFGNGGDDTLYGGELNDYLDGGTGYNRLIGGTGSDIMIVRSATDIVEEAFNEGAIDTVRSTISYTLTANVEILELYSSNAINGTGNDLDNYIVGTYSDNVLEGRGGNDILIAYGGNDIMRGGLGDDKFYVYASTGQQVIEFENEGIDTVESFVTYTLPNHVEHLLLRDQLNPAGGNALAANGTGNNLDNTITGNSVANLLTGGAGNDHLIGNGGNDTLRGGAGVNRLDGGAGDDIASYDDMTTGVTVDMTAIDQPNRDTLISIETLVGSNFGDHLTGDHLGNRILGGTGVDTIIGGGGDDWLYGNSILRGNDQDNHLEGGAGNDHLYGDSGSDTLIGYRPDSAVGEVDWLDGRGGADFFHVDHGDHIAEMEVGDQIIFYAQAPVTRVVIEYTGVTTLLHAIAEDGTVRTVTIDTGIRARELRAETFLGEAIVFSRVAPVGDPAFRFATDPVQARAMGLQIVSDNLNGYEQFGARLKTFIEKETNAGTVLKLTDAVKDALLKKATDTAKDTLLNRLSNVPNALKEKDYAKLAEKIGKWALDLIDGKYKGNPGGASVELAGIFIEVAGPKIVVGGDIAYRFGRDVLGPIWTDLAIGMLSSMATVQADWERGGTGSDRPDVVSIDTRTGTSRMGNGDDIAVIKSLPGPQNGLEAMATGFDRIIDGGDGVDGVIYSTSVAMTIDLTQGYARGAAGGSDQLIGIEDAYGGDGNDLIVGSAVANTLVGGAGNDVLQGLAGDDVLDGGAGVDQMIGGAGDDTYHADQQGDVVFEATGGGYDRVIASSDFYLYAEIEALELTGTGNTAGVGNALDNDITGNSGANTLIGWGGNDIIRGGAGNDSVFGVDGADQLYGEAGIDTIVAGAGNDLADGGADADAIYGEDGDDTLIGGNTFDTDILVGGAGNDVLDGNSGLGDFDYLYGNAGDDIYWVDTYADLVFELPGEGTDTVHADIRGTGYYLYANIENLVLVNQTTFGVGNELANRITGSDAANYLLGGAGNDVLNGMGGNDVLFGEAGADTFVFQRGAGADTIGDFQIGVDRIDLSDFGFTSLAQVQAATGENGGTSFIQLGGGDYAVINGVTKASLTARDFIFAVASADAVEPMDATAWVDHSRSPDLSRDLGLATGTTLDHWRFDLA